MRRVCSTIVSVFFLSFIIGNLFAGVKFGSRDSAFKVASGATLNVGSSNLNVDGTIAEDAGASITGNTFTFSQGVFSRDGLQALLTATFDPTDGDTINLTGNSKATVDPGTTIRDVTVAGTGNEITGGPVFSSPIEFADGSTGLNLGLHEALNQDVNLNGGTLTLVNQLRLADDVKLNGPGTVVLNDRRLDLGGYYSSAWTSNLTFIGATDVVLNGYTELDGTWTFNGTSRVNGNGAILNLCNGGQINVAAGGTLYLTDVYIKGVSDIHGGFTFGDATSQVRLNNVTIDLAGDFSMSLGHVYIEGKTTFILRDKIWTFDGSALLTVCSELWLDVFDFDYELEPLSPPPGELRAPLSIFKDHVYSQVNVASNIAAGNLAICETTQCQLGQIREVSDRSFEFEEPLFQIVNCNIELTRSVHVPPGKIVQIGVPADFCAEVTRTCGFDGTPAVTIDGHGATIIFADTDHSQFVVPAGSAVYLTNIELSRINNKTFDLQGDPTGVLPPGRICIGPNVTFELSEDTVIPRDLYNEKHELTGQDEEVPALIIVENASVNVFRIRGLAGKKRFVMRARLDAETDTGLIDSGPFYYDNTVKTLNLYRPTMHLGANSIMLQNVELIGLEYIRAESANIDGELIDPSIALAGNSTVSVTRDTSMAFDAEDINNELMLKRDALQLSGSISFLGNAERNELLISTALIEPNDADQFTIDQIANRKVGVGSSTGSPEDDTNPLIIFNGDTGIYLTNTDEDLGTNGIAGLIFDDPTISIRNTNSNAFVIEENSFLRVKRMEVLDNPIKQQSVAFDLEAIEFYGEGIDQSFIRSRSKAMTAKTPHTSFIKMRKKEREKYANKASITPVVYGGISKPGKIHRPKPGKKVKRKKNKKKKRKKRDLELRDVELTDGDTREEDFEYYEEEELARGDELHRALNLPPGGFSSGETRRGGTYIEEKALSENHRLQGARVNNFFVDPLLPLNVLLEGGGKLYQSLTQDVTLVQDIHVVNVKGVGNVLFVTGNMTIPANTLFLDQNSELIVRFVPVGGNIPVLTFQEGTYTVEKNATLMFDGPGKLKLSDGTVIYLNGERIFTITDGQNAPGKIEGRANLTFDNGAICEIQEVPEAPVAARAKKNKNKARAKQAEAFISGLGYFKVDTGSRLDIFGNTKLTIAPSATIVEDFWQKPGEKIKRLREDDIDVFVASTGEIAVGASANDSDESVIATGKGATSWTFESNGKLTIRDKGVLAFNDQASDVPARVQGDPLGSTLTRGHIKAISFMSDAGIYIEEGGRWTMGINRFPYWGADVALKLDVTLNPITVIAGGGIVEYVSRTAADRPQQTYVGFEAPLLVPTGTKYIAEQTTLEAFAQLLTTAPAA